MARDVLTRIIERTMFTDSGCWEWTGPLGAGGYGLMGIATGKRGGKSRPVHRVAYEILVGPIPGGLPLDHQCHNDAVVAGTCTGGPCPHRKCWNPMHLEPTTRAVNTLRGDTIPTHNAAKTHCPQNHPYSGVDILGRRFCVTCKNENNRRYRARLREPGTVSVSIKRPG